MDPWAMDLWALGPMGPWTHGPLDPLALGPMGPWTPQGSLGGTQGALGEKRRKNVVKNCWSKNAEKMW